MIARNIFNKNTDIVKQGVSHFEYDNVEVPKTDNITISFLNQDLNVIDINLIFKMIDDITEYITGELGLNTLKDILVLYDDTNANVDRFANVF